MVVVVVEGRVEKEKKNWGRIGKGGGLALITRC